MMEIRDTTKLDIPRDTATDAASTRRGGPASGDAGRAEPGGQPTSGDRVTLTPAARHLLETTEAGAPVDEAKVAAIRAAIADGSYTVDAGRVAERLIGLDNSGRS